METKIRGGLEVQQNNLFRSATPSLLGHLLAIFNYVLLRKEHKNKQRGAMKLFSGLPESVLLQISIIPKLK